MKRFYKYILLFLIIGMTACNDNGLVFPENDPVVSFYAKGYSFGEDLEMYINGKKVESTGTENLPRANALFFHTSEQNYHFMLVKSSDTTQILREFDIKHPETSPGYNTLMFFNYIYDGENLLGTIPTPEAPTKDSLIRAQIMLRMNISAYHEAVDIRFYYLDKDNYTRTNIQKMTNIEYVAELNNVIPSMSEFLPSIDIPLDTTNEQRGGTKTYINYLYMDVVKAGTNDLVWDKGSGDRLFTPTVLGNYDEYNESKGKKEKKLYSRGIYLYVLDEQNPSNNFGNFEIVDVEPYMTWYGFDKRGITVK